MWPISLPILLLTLVLAVQQARADFPKQIEPIPPEDFIKFSAFYVLIGIITGVYILLLAVMIFFGVATNDWCPALRILHYYRARQPPVDVVTKRVQAGGRRRRSLIKSGRAATSRRH